MITHIENNALAGLFAGLDGLLDDLLRRCFGPAIDRTILSPITLGDLLSVLCLVLLALGVNGLAAALLRHHAKKTSAGHAESWKHHVLGALENPLYLFIWVCGIYVAATPLLRRLPEEGVFELLGKVFNGGVFAALLWFFYRFTRVIEARLAAMAAKTSSKLDDLFVPLLGRSLRIILPVVGIIFALPLLGLSAQYAGMLGKASSIMLIVTVALVLSQAVHVGEKAALARYDVTAADNLKARTIYTQVHVISKVLYVVIALFAVASVLMLFEEVRRFGASILASAGVVGIIIGFAAQKTIANLFAGFQLAMTQPIRLDDVVVVEGEWGRVEEITLTYVVIHIWDDRRLVVPLGYFIEKPFQNWTRVSAELLGSVMIWADYSLPLGEIRQALKDIIETHPLWDKRFWNLQVTDATDRAMQVRVLATATDSSSLWTLRCDIREKLIAFVQKNHPGGLPRIRAHTEFERLSNGPAVRSAPIDSNPA